MSKGIKRSGLLLGIKGIKRSGKDTIANILIQHYGFNRISFADALYQQVANIFNVSVEFLRADKTKEMPLKELELSNILEKEPVFVKYCVEELGMFLTHWQSPRRVLQEYGNWKRNVFGKNYWIEQVFALIESKPNEHFCIADVRYKNEFDIVNERGITVEVYCEPIYNKWYEQYLKGDPVACHISETDLMNESAKIKLINQWGDMTVLEQAVHSLMKELL